MNITISIHETPKAMYDALPVPELAPTNGSDTRWKTLESDDGTMSVTFFKTHE